MGRPECRRKLHEEVTVERAQKLEWEETVLPQRLRQFYVAHNEGHATVRPNEVA